MGFPVVVFGKDSDLVLRELLQQERTPNPVLQFCQGEKRWSGVQSDEKNQNSGRYNSTSASAGEIIGEVAASDVIMVIARNNGNIDGDDYLQLMQNLRSNLRQ
jgi:hypothetical protein